MYRDRRHRTLLVATGILTLVIPVVLIAILPIPSISNLITKTLDTDNVTFLGLFLDYYSISITLILGIVVYYQSDRINNLEASQYNLYIGVDDLDYTFNFGNYFASDRCSSDFNISHIFTSSKKALRSTVNIGEGDGKTLLIPLVFITKNNPLIVSINFQSVDLLAREKNTTLCKETFHRSGGDIKTLLCDGSKFIFGFGLVIPESYNPDEIHLQFDVIVKDQNSNSQNMKTSVSLYRIKPEDDFVITSSNSNYV